MNDDIISRSGAVALILSGKVGDDSLVECPEECNSFLDWAAEEVGKMPSAERKKGKWVRIEDENGDFLCWECSECRERYVMPYHRASYCPNCGADMRGEEG